MTRRMRRFFIYSTNPETNEYFRKISSGTQTQDSILKAANEKNLILNMLIHKFFGSTL